MLQKYIQIFTFLIVAILFQSCASSYKYSYEGENEPLFEGDYRKQKIIKVSSTNSIVKVVSFNIEFAQNIEEAIDLLQNDQLSSADVLLLQEMDEKGTERLAKSLDMSYVYYPAIYHPKHKQNVGNAILTKWNINKSKKVKLPHPSTYPVPFEGKNYIFRKTATVANITINGNVITFASTHAAAFNTTQKRREFASALANEMDNDNIQFAVVGGDFNSLGEADINATVQSFTNCCFLWASQFVGMTISEKKPILSAVPLAAFQLDHLFVKGMFVKDAGKISQNGVSDHLPIWVDLELEKQ